MFRNVINISIIIFAILNVKNIIIFLKEVLL